MGIIKVGLGLAIKSIGKIGDAIDDGKAIADANAKRFAGKQVKKSAAKKFLKNFK